MNYNLIDNEFRSIVASTLTSEIFLEEQQKKNNIIQTKLTHCMQEINEKHGFKEESIHHNLVLMDKIKMFEYIRLIIKEHWNPETVVPMSRFFTEYKQLFEERFDEIFSNGQLDIFSKRQHMSWQNYTEYFFTELSLGLHSSENQQLLSIWVIEIEDKYIVQPTFNKTEFVDYFLLYEKLKVSCKVQTLSSENINKYVKTAERLIRVIARHITSNDKDFKSTVQLLVTQFCELLEINNKSIHLTILSTAFKYPEKIYDYNFGSTPKSVLDLKKSTKKHLYPLMLRVRPNNRTRYTDAFPFYQGFTRFTRVNYTSDSKRTKSGAY